MPPTGELSRPAAGSPGEPIATFPAAGWRDIACVLILVVACVLLRVPSLDRAVLNPDESQYEATASYLAATDSSPFSYALGAPGTYALFTLASRVFGPYSIYEIRLLVQLMCLGQSLILFWVVSRNTNRWCGLAAGLVFVHYVMLFEGLTVNREWFATLMTTTGLCLWFAVVDRCGLRADGVRFLSGLATGFSLWFKLQASFTVLAVPLAIVWRAVERRRVREGARRLGVFALGGVVCGAAYLLPYWISGSLGQFLSDVLRDWIVFVRGNEEAVRAASDGAAWLYLQRFLLELPHRPLLLASYFFAALVLVQASISAWRAADRRPFAARPATVAFTAWLITSGACVQLGHRFWSHYYQLMMPAVSALCGFALYWLWHEARSRREGRALALALLVALAVEAVFQARGLAAGALDSQAVFTWIYVAGAAGSLAYLAWRPLDRAPRVAAAWLGLHILVLVGIQQTTPTPLSMSHNPYSFDALAAHLREASRPGDRLFVWGWAPEIYSLTRLESASQVVTSEYVVRDFPAVPVRPTLDPVWAERMMRDLREREPRFIVDASARSWTCTDARFYRLDLYPGFEFVELLREHYLVRGRIDGCVIWERRRPPDPGAPAALREDETSPQSVL